MTFHNRSGTSQEIALPRRDKERCHMLIIQALFERRVCPLAVGIVYTTGGGDGSA